MKLPPTSVSWLQVGPPTLILLFFFVLPMLVVVAVSFFDYDMRQIIPTFIARQLSRRVHLSRNLEHLPQLAQVCRHRLGRHPVIGFNVSPTSWRSMSAAAPADGVVPALHGPVPDLQHHPHDLLGAVPRPNGLLNQALLRLGLIHQPLEFLLFSDFAVVLAYVHLYTLFMVTPIFNTMMRIDRRLIEAALDGGAGRFRGVMRDRRCRCQQDRHRHRLDLRRDAGDGRFLHRAGDERRAERVGRADDRQPDFGLQYPAAAANAVVLLVIVTAHGRGHPARRRHPQGTRDRRRATAWRNVMPDRVPGRSDSSPRSSSLFVMFLYGPMFVIYILSFQGPGRRTDVPDARVSPALVPAAVRTERALGDFGGAFARSLGAGADGDGC